MVLVSQTWLDVILLVAIGIVSFGLLIVLPVWFCCRKAIIEWLSDWLAKNKKKSNHRADSDAGASSRPLSKISVIDWRGAAPGLPNAGQNRNQPQVQVHVYDNGVLLAIKDQENRPLDPSSGLQVGVYNPHNMNVGTLSDSQQPVVTVYKQNNMVGGSEISVGLPSRGVLSVDRADVANKRFAFGSSQKPPRKDSAGLIEGRSKDFVFHSVNGQFKFNKGLAEEDSFAERDESPTPLDLNKDVQNFKVNSAFVKPKPKNLFEGDAVLPDQEGKPALVIHDPEVGEFTLENSPVSRQPYKQDTGEDTQKTTPKARPLKLNLLKAKQLQADEEPVRDPPLSSPDTRQPATVYPAFEQKPVPKQLDSSMDAIQKSQIMEGDISIGRLPSKLADPDPSATNKAGNSPL